jgi:hypothetical protein
MNGHGALWVGEFAEQGRVLQLAGSAITMPLPGVTFGPETAGRTALARRGERPTLGCIA